MKPAATGSDEAKSAVGRNFGNKSGKNPLTTRASEDEVDPILTVPMVAEYLLCHPSTIYRLLKNRQIPGFRVGSDWRFKRSDIVRWLNNATMSANR